MLQIDAVTYASVVTKMSFASPSIPLGHSMGPAGTARGPLGSNQTLVNSKNVTNRCCHICFSDDKNVFGITLYSLGVLGGARRAPPRGPSGSNQNLVNSKNVTNGCCHICFGDDKNVFGIALYSLGVLGGARRAPPRGPSRSNQNLVNSKNLINIYALIWVCNRVI